MLIKGKKNKFLIFEIIISLSIKKKLLQQLNIPLRVKNNHTFLNFNQKYEGNCPNCGIDLSNTKLYYPDKYEHCNKCGQFLDWNDKKPLRPWHKSIGYWGSL